MATFGSEDLNAGVSVVSIEQGRREAEDFGGCEELGLNDWRWICFRGEYGFADKIEGHVGEEFGRGRG